MTEPMLTKDHCRTCAGPVEEFPDGRWHHVDTLPEGFAGGELFDVMARELDHDATPCRSACDAWALQNGGRDMHGGPLSESWVELAAELVEVPEIPGDHPAAPWFGMVGLVCKRCRRPIAAHTVYHDAPPDPPPPAGEFDGVDVRGLYCPEPDEPPAERG